jgi:hypothetical protein
MKGIRTLCPPLDDRDIERQWKQSLNWANRKIKEREESEKKTTRTTKTRSIRQQ